MKNRIVDLGGEYSRDDQFLDLWNLVKTLKEKEFTRFVRQLRDEEARKDTTTREPIENANRDICAKQTRMEVDNEWNVMSEEDNVIMTLMGMVQAQSKKPKSNDDTSTKSTKKPYVIPEWKKIPPNPGERNVKTVDDRVYHWCRKCRDGNGMWSLHKEGEHVDNFKRNKSDKDKKSTSVKAVSFNVSDSSDDSTGDSKASKLQVKQELLADAKAFITQLTDFQTGGV